MECHITWQNVARWLCFSGKLTKYLVACTRPQAPKELEEEAHTEPNVGQKVNTHKRKRNAELGD